jgi:magnesium transporter
MVSNRLNETMRRLTVIGAIFAALTVLTGIYGMNFEHMPELRWRYGYLMVWVVGAFISGGLILWFKKKQWI